MTVLVAGAGGYLGSRLCPATARAGHRVVAVSRRRPTLGVPKGVAEWLEADLGAPCPAVHRAVGASAAVVDLVGLASAAACARRPEDAVRANAMARVHLLDAMAAARPRATRLYLYTSSLGAARSFGRTGAVPSGRRTVYDATKVLGELLVERATRDGDATPSAKPVILRLGHVFGPSPALGPTSVVGRFLLDALTSGRLSLNGSGGDRRAFVYIDDAVDAILDALAPGAGVQAGTYDLAGQERSVRELAEIVAGAVTARTGRPVAIVPQAEAPRSLAPAPSEGRRRPPAPGRAFPRPPAVTLEDGVERTIDWILAHGMLDTEGERRCFS